MYCPEISTEMLYIRQLQDKSAVAEDSAITVTMGNHKVGVGYMLIPMGRIPPVCSCGRGRRSTRINAVWASGRVKSIQSYFM